MSTRRPEPDEQVGQVVAGAMRPVGTVAGHHHGGGAHPEQPHQRGDLPRHVDHEQRGVVLRHPCRDQTHALPIAGHTGGRPVQRAVRRGVGVGAEVHRQVHPVALPVVGPAQRTQHGYVVVAQVRADRLQSAQVPSPVVVHVPTDHRPPPLIAV